MSSRWKMLFILVIARLALGLSFQSAGSASPYLSDDFSMNLADVGVLVGILCCRVSSWRCLQARGRTACFTPTIDEVEAFLQSETRAGDVVVMMGAGRVGECFADRAMAACRSAPEPAPAHGNEVAK